MAKQCIRCPDSWLCGDDPKCDEAMTKKGPNNWELYGVAEVCDGCRVQVWHKFDENGDCQIKLKQLP